MSSNTQTSTEVSRDSRPAFLPPRLVIRLFWLIHRALFRFSGGRFGLRRPTDTKWGMMRLRTMGRRSGRERIAILAYFEDGRDIVTMAMNGWGEPEPAWWLNLQADPDVVVELPGERRAVRGRVATAGERPRLWARWAAFNGPNQEGWAARRGRETAVVILEPRPTALASADGRSR